MLEYIKHLVQKWNTLDVLGAGKKYIRGHDKPINTKWPTFFATRMQEIPTGVEWIDSNCC